jgi:hypothetical protein
MRGGCRRAQQARASIVRESGWEGRGCHGKVVQTWAMQDRLGRLQQLGAIVEVQPVNWAGGDRRNDAR